MTTSKIKQKIFRLKQLTQSLLSSKRKNRYFEEIYKKKLKKIGNLEKQQDEQIANKLIF